MELRESVSSVFGAWMIGDGKVESSEKECPPSFGVSQVLQVLMTSENDERMLCTFQPMPPFLQGQLNSKEFPVADVVILLRRPEFAREESAWMFGWSPLLLRQHRSYPGGGGVHFHDEGSVGVWVDEERCAGECLLE